MERVFDHSFWCLRRQGLACGYKWQIARDYDPQMWRCGRSFVIGGEVYGFIEPALAAALGEAGGTYAHACGVFHIPDEKIRSLAGKVGMLKARTSLTSPWSMKNPFRTQYPTKVIEIRNEIVRFLLQSARQRRSLTILGI